MRLATAVAVLVALTRSAVASTDGIPGIEVLAALHDSATSSLFPAGVPHVEASFGHQQYEAPPVPENAYRGVYVSASKATTTPIMRSRGLEQHLQLACAHAYSRYHIQNCIHKASLLPTHLVVHAIQH